MIIVLKTARRYLKKENRQTHVDYTLSLTMKERRSMIWIIHFLHLMVFCNLVIAKSEYTNLFERCANEKNTFDCFKRRALEILDSAIQDDSVYKINDYISITKDPTSIARSHDSMTSENGTELSLDQKLDNKFYEYLTSRSVKLTISGNAFEGNIILKLLINCVIKNLFCFLIKSLQCKL